MCALSCAKPISITPQLARVAISATRIVLHAGGQVQLAILVQLGINLVPIKHAKRLNYQAAVLRSIMIVARHLARNATPIVWHASIPPNIVWHAMQAITLRVGYAKHALRDVCPAQQSICAWNAPVRTENITYCFGVVCLLSMKLFYALTICVLFFSLLATTYLSITLNECLTSIPSGYYGYNNACVEACPSGYFADSNSLC